MAKKKKKKQGKKRAGVNANALETFNESDAPRLQEEVGALITAGRQKAALDRAKSFAKAVTGAAADALLLKAYMARIEGMLAKNMAREALSLLDLVEARFPNESTCLGRLRSRGLARGGKLEDLVAPLAEANLDREHRSEIEEALARELVDLDALAQCATLPKEHPLRIAAAEVRDAFTKVCSEPVSDEDIALPAVSRRSPLAPWKLLIRAIACFYRKEDEACLDCISRLPSGTAPARLALVFQELCGKSSQAKLWPAAKKLRKEIQGDDAALRSSLTRCENIFLHMEDRDPFYPMKSAVAQCEKARPKLAERLKKHLSVLLLGSGVDPAELKEVLGFAACKDAYFWCLAAKKSERIKDTFFARSCWEEFRIHAIHEGWFAADSAVEAALLLHMADLKDPDEEDVEYDYFGEPMERETLPFGEKSMQRHYRDQTKEIQVLRAKLRKPVEAIHQDRNALFARACKLDCRPENFLTWGADEAIDKEEVLWHWSVAIPEDPEPLVCLAKDAYRRKALKKALDYLKQAEARNALDPRVRRLRIQIAIATATRHLKAGKAHLLRKDIVELEALDVARENNGPALLAAFTWAAASMENADEERDLCAERVVALLGNPVGSHLLLSGMAGIANKLDQWPVTKVATSAFRDEAEWLASVARALLLVSLADLMLAFKRDHAERLEKALQKKRPEATGKDLVAMASVFLAYTKTELAYEAAGAGLRLQTPLDARLLMLRAQALPKYAHARRDNCLGAALCLARSGSDSELSGEIMAAFQGNAGNLYDMELREESLNINAAGAKKMLAIERKLIDPKTRTDLPVAVDNAISAIAPPTSFFSMENIFGREMEDCDDDDDWDDDDDDEDCDDGDDEWEVIETIRSFIERITGSGSMPRNPKQFEEYCVAVPAIGEEWAALKKRYKTVFGVPFEFSALAF